MQLEALRGLADLLSDELLEHEEITEAVRVAAASCEAFR